MTAVPPVASESDERHVSREQWLAEVVTGPRTPRMEWAEARLHGEDPSESRAWTRLTALVATQCPAAVMEAPRLDGRTGALVEGVAVARGGALLEGAEILGEVVSDARLSVDEPVLTWALAEQGRAWGMSGDISGAAAALSEAATLAERTAMPIAGCMARSNLGMLYAQEGRSIDYERHTRLALEIARESGDVEGLALGLSNLGGALTTQKRFEEAASALTEARELAEKHLLRRIEALATSALGGLSIETGDIEGGLRLYDAAGLVLADIPDPFQVGYNDVIAGRLLLQQERPELALQRARGAGSHGSRYGLIELQVRASDLESLVLESLGRLGESLQAARRSAALERGRLDARVAASKQAGERSQRSLLALKRAAWERQRRQELEQSDRALRDALAEETRLRAILEETARTDSLTGIANRRAHESDVRAILADAARAGREVAMLIIDIDHFKAINDRYGHEVGDEVLVGVAQRLQGTLRASDRVARWGGEEFTVCAPGVGFDGAERVASTLLTSIRGAPFDTQVGPVRVTVSIGAAVHDPGLPAGDRTFRVADAALYRAKREGRDRAVVARSIEEDETEGLGPA